MMNVLNYFTLNRLVNMFIPLFFVGLLTITGGQNIPWGLMVIAFFYLIYATFKKDLYRPSKEEKWLIFSYLFYFATFVVSVLYHHGRLRELDSPSRLIFFLPILFLLVKEPIRFRLLAISVPLGAFVAGGFALYQRFVLGNYAAFEQIFQIQGGDMSMSLGMFSLVFVFYFAQRKNYPLTLFALLGTFGGILGSILSTARGGWIGVPVLVAVIFYIFRKTFSKKFFIGIGLFLLLAVTAVALNPKTSMISRIHTATNEVQNYKNTSTSVGIRFDLWKSAIFMAQEKPLLGWGQENIIAQREKLHKAGLIGAYAVPFGHQHNQYLDDLSKRGVLGLAGIFAIFLIPLGFFIKNLKTSHFTQRVIATLGIVHVLSVMSYSLTQSFFMHNSGVMFYFFLTVVFYAMILVEKKRT